MIGLVGPVLPLPGCLPTVPTIAILAFLLPGWAPLRQPEMSEAPVSLVLRQTARLEVQAIEAE